MTTNATTSIKLTRTIPAAPDAVFRAWTEPAQMSKWSAPEGASVAAVDVDLTVGGKYHIQMRTPDGIEHNAHGEYRVIEPPNRLQYTWQWEESSSDVGETLVTIDFVDLDGSTEVRLTHDLFPTDEARKGHEDGWNSCLNRFEQLFA